MKKVFYSVLVGVLCVFLNAVVCPAADKPAEQSAPGSKCDPAAVKAAEPAKAAAAAEKPAVVAKAAAEKAAAPAGKPAAVAEKPAAESAAPAEKPATVAEKPAATDAASTLEVVEIAIAKNIQDRAPQDVADTFPAGTEKIYCYTKLNGGKEGDFILHRWKKGDEVMGEVTLKVNGSPWRTYSSKSIAEDAAGKWMVEIVQNGTVLKSKEFTIQ